MEQIKKWSFLSKSGLILLSIFFACSQPQPKKVKANSGFWRMEMELKKGKTLPFEFQLKEDKNSWSMIIFNHEEEIEVNNLTWKNDTLIAPLPIFDSEFVLVLENESLLNGYWANYYKGDDYKIKVSALFGQETRFSNLSDSFDNDFGGKYEVFFSPKSEDEYKAIGLFSQKGNEVFGTFATETGDYRHLSGNVSGKKIMLSTFDGSHAFLFEAEKNDSGLTGIFYSGTHWEEPWVATKNENVLLKNPDSLTFLKPGFDSISFRFPNAEGKLVSLSDEKYQNKAVIVQIMGSWCPNCLDETKYLTTLYNKYNLEGLEVIALAFERTKTQEKAFENLKKLKNKTGAPYAFLLGGATRNDKAENKLPMLNHIMSYPTAIFIDKTGEIRKIHTGFYGPSTGKYYTDFVKETEKLVEDMLEN